MIPRAFPEVLEEASHWRDQCDDLREQMRGKDLQMQAMQGQGGASGTMGMYQLKKLERDVEMLAQQMLKLEDGQIAAGDSSSKASEAQLAAFKKEIGAELSAMGRAV